MDTFVRCDAPSAACAIVCVLRRNRWIDRQTYEKDFAEQRTFPEGLKEIEHLYDVGRGQVR